MTAAEAEDGTRHEPPPVALIVMGVSGSGKSSVAKALAERLGWRFEEGDQLHPPANVEKMRAGVPLTDEDRVPWLETIARILETWRVTGEHGVVTCSALKRAYRQTITGTHENARFVHLTGSFELLQGRINARKGHYMPASLLRSQFDTLEPPGPDEDAIVVDVEPPVAAIVEAVLDDLGLGAVGPKLKPV